MVSTAVSEGMSELEMCAGYRSSTSECVLDCQAVVAADVPGSSFSHLIQQLSGQSTAGTIWSCADASRCSLAPPPSATNQRTFNWADPNYPESSAYGMTIRYFWGSDSWHTWGFGLSFRGGQTDKEFGAYTIFMGSDGTATPDGSQVFHSVTDSNIFQIRYK